MTPASRRGLPRRFVVYPGRVEVSDDFRKLEKFSQGHIARSMCASCGKQSTSDFAIQGVSWNPVKGLSLEYVGAEP